MAAIILYSGTIGLNTVLDPQRLSQGAVENPGIIELAQSVNVSVDDRGLITRRSGCASVANGNYHSLFCDGGDCFVVQDNATDSSIMKVDDTDYSLSLVVDGLRKGALVEFAKINSDTFYSNGYQNGFIRDGIRYDWPINVYRGPDVDIQFLTSIPKAHHIAFRHGGQCIIAVDDYVLINHEPFKFGLFSPVLGFIKFSSKVTMLCPVSEGFYASDSEKTWFFRKVQGGWYQYRQELIDTSPALEWSLATDLIKLNDIGFDSPGFGRVWASQQGICIGTDNGQIFNVTKSKVKYPSGYSSGACLIKEYTVIHTAS